MFCDILVFIYVFIITSVSISKFVFNMRNEYDKTVESSCSPESGGTLSSEDTDNILPTNLHSEELQLALNQEATEHDLLEAINRCKELILENTECSAERKWIVRHLIELRFRLQEHKEAMEDPRHPRNKSSGASSRSIKGHHLKLQSLLKNAGHRYCDHCTGTIWSVVQAWYMCEDCAYACHYKCLSSIVRECAHVVACEKGQYEFKICPEVGLSAQKYLCAECRTPLVVHNVWPDAKRCDYTGLYYCSACHWESSAIIPARVIHNWDFEPRAVSQASLQILRVTADRPLINLEQLNPRLFHRIQELNLVKRLRQELQGIRKYLVVCRKAVDEHLIWKCDRAHLIENVNVYSLQDLVDTHSGDLPSKLHDLVDEYLRHIKTECEICQGRGHICEICRNEEVLFPFASNAYVCEVCTAVSHKVCIERKERCPRCVRAEKRLQHFRDLNTNTPEDQLNS
ncbi:differentially expressed in FDCP 8 homolog [Dendroctonus ponderosae]|nr:differentially expressed in FDCP 8 homolog [Dendroctonus ponderosae]